MKRVGGDWRSLGGEARARGVSKGAEEAKAQTPDGRAENQGDLGEGPRAVGLQKGSVGTGKRGG